MRQSNRISNVILYALIFLSGVSGLIYQVVWHRYLVILLGAQARATAIVLAIFLGGISVGYLTFGSWTRTKRWNLLVAYTFVELAMGIWGMIFPDLFHLVFPLAAKLYAAVGVTHLGIDVFFSLLLIGFPTFLMGGTLPLLTQGMSRSLSDASETHAKIYGFNTLGACVGALLAGYVLIPNTNFLATSAIAGAINMFVGAVVYFLFARGQARQAVTAPKKAAGSWMQVPIAQMPLMLIALLSGFYTITLETVMIRMMGLSMGSSNYNFTLVVSIFILALGTGSLVARKIGQYTAKRLFWNQVAVSFGLYLLYLSGDCWSYWVHLIRVSFSDIPEAFYLYQGVVGLIFASLLILPIGLAGLTLPLCFHLIKDRQETLGLRVGQLYSVNTIGCVLGAILGGYAFFYFWDLDQLFKFCVFLSLTASLAAALLYFPKERPGWIQGAFASVMALALSVGIVLAPRYTHERWIQAFRHSHPMPLSFTGPQYFGDALSHGIKLLYWKDGPNTSVGIGATRRDDHEEGRTILVNGKSDGNTKGDIFTTAMLAHLPGLFAKKLDNTFVVGFGTGITIGLLAQYPTKEIDVAEISNVSIETANYFDKYNFNASKSPKVKFHEMDAFRFLEGTTKTFDVIVSEPSNPWVAGVENLYTSDFYEIAHRKLSSEGVFVQWIHTYSFSDELMRMVFQTMGKHFPSVSVFELRGGDLALVGWKVPPASSSFATASWRMQLPDVQPQLMALGISKLESVLALEIVSPSVVHALGEDYPTHELEKPRLSNEAAKAFFAGLAAHILTLRRTSPQYYSAIEESLLTRYLEDKSLSYDALREIKAIFCDRKDSENGHLCAEALVGLRLMDQPVLLSANRGQIISPSELDSVGQIKTFATKRAFNEADLTALQASFDVYKNFASPIAHIRWKSLEEGLNACLATVPKSKDLWGECLIQKVVLLDTVIVDRTPFHPQIKEYLDWFQGVSPTSPRYHRFEQAKNMLTRMLKSG